ncbi:hypothetical protein DFH28DRAFT_1095578 [Melampsora americana]|nr:hypothetical protein DFH28DRAFT_1095578 [Melampsora americana]
MIQAAIFHPYYQNKPGFLLARRALTPLIILVILDSVKYRIWEPLGECMMVNFPFVSLVTFHGICLALQFGLYDGPIFKSSISHKRGEKNAEKIENITKESESGKSLQEDATPSAPEATNTNAEVHNNSPNPVSPPSFGALVRFVVLILLSPRALDFAWAPPESVLKRPDPIPIKDFLIGNLLRLLKMHLHGTIFWTIAVHAFHHQDGIYGILTQSIGLPRSKALEFISGYGLSFCLGASMWSGLEIASCAVNIVEAIFWPIARRILPSDLAPQDEFDTTRYPELFSTPWARESLCDFWGRGWHSLFRRDLIFCAAMPLGKLFGRFGKDAGQIGGLLGAMGLSAFMHEYAIASISRARWDYEIVVFFMNCAMVMLFETVLEKFTKFKICGIFGHIWTYGWLMYLGKPGMDLWMVRGLGEGMTPVSQWTWKRFVFPAGTLMPNEWLDVLIPF